MTTESTTRTVYSPAPISVAATLGTLRRGPGDPTMIRDGSRTWLTQRMPSGPVTLLLEQVGPREITATAWGEGAAERCESLPDLLGLGDSLDGFVPAHPSVADAHRRFPGLRIPRTGRVMEALLPAVIEQRVLGVDAFASWRRIVTRLGDPAPGPGPDRLRVMPAPETWAAIPAWEWHTDGVDPQRYRTAQRCARVGSRLDLLAATEGREATYRALRSIGGVGRWTAAEVGGRALGDADAVPWGDYHLGHLVGVGLVGRRLHDDADIAGALEPYRGHGLRVVRLLSLSPLVRLERRGPRLSRSTHHTR